MAHSLLTGSSHASRQDLAGDAGSRELYQLAQKYPLPDFVKKADLSQHRDPPRPSVKLYADVRQPYQFPCHTPEATIVSALYFYDKAASFAPTVSKKIDERLRLFADHWGVTNAVTAIQEKAAQADAPPRPESDADYAINVKIGGVHKRRVPLRTALEVKQAAEWFCENLPVMRQNMTFLNRQAVALRILDKAAAHNADLGDTQDVLEKSAGYGASDTEHVTRGLHRRAQMVPNAPESLRSAMLKLAEEVQKNPRLLLDPALSAQLAESVDGFDRATGLLEKYSSFTPSPEELVFSVTHYKLAHTVKTSCQLTNGKIYSHDQLRALTVGDLSDAFGTGFVRKVLNGLDVDTEKLASLTSTLPRNEADLISALLEEKNEYPLAVESD